MKGQIITDKHYDRQVSLLDWCNNGYGGMSGLQNVSDLPKDMLEFCVSQYHRFGIPMPPIEVIEKGMWAAFSYVDYMDPYALLFGVTDVEANDHWAEFTFDITNQDGSVEEADPELLETFMLIPGRDEHIFNLVYNHPGLESPEIRHIGDGIEEIISGMSMSDDDVYAESSNATKAWLDQHSPKFVTVKELPVHWVQEPREKYVGDDANGDSVYKVEYIEAKADIGHYKKHKSGHGLSIWGDYFSRPEVIEHYESVLANQRALETRLDYYRLSAWAALTWMISPMARTWRDTTYDIFHLCYKHGEAVLYSGYFIRHDTYKKIERHPQSCVVCGLKSWCVELAFLEGVNRFLCEHHLNGELPKMAQFMCGTKVCKYTECRFHPLHGVENGRGLAYRQSGQLKTMIANNAPMIGNSRVVQKLLS